MEIKTYDGAFSWPVTITKKRDGGYAVVGRMSAFRIYLTSTDSGLMVSIPGERRCGYVPKDCTANDIMEYCEFDKFPVDAATVATAVREIVKGG